MPKQQRRRGPDQRIGTPRAPAGPKSVRTDPNQSEGSLRRLVILGSGADADYGLPTMANLMHQLAAFARGDGEPIDKELRKKLPYLHFTFDKFAGGQGDILLTRLFSGDDELTPRLRSAADKLKSDQEMSPVASLIEHLCAMASDNRLSGPSLTGIAQLAGETGQVGDAEPLLDPQKISLSSIPANALRRGFQEALVRGPDLTADERDTLELFVLATSNIEELLSLYFTKYHSGSAADQKTFLYLAWMLWAFLRVRSSGLAVREGTIYAQLPRLGADVITFNYTNFFERTMLGRVRFFHGRLDQFLRMDTRELVSDDPKLRAAVDIEHIVALIDSLRLDIKGEPAIDIPAIVPPTSFKPVMSREQLRTWIEADNLLQKADVVVIVGYSFSVADEHFNDLLRKSNPSNHVLVVNPNLVVPAQAACQIFGVNFDALAVGMEGSFEVRRSKRLTCVKASAGDVDSSFLTIVLTAT